MTAVVTPLQPGRGTRAPARPRRRKLTLDRVSFMLVFLGVPLAIYVIFVVSPFVQAVYYSMTDWSGFTATQIEIALTKALSILSQVGTSGGVNNVNVRYRKQY